MQKKEELTPQEHRKLKVIKLNLLRELLQNAENQSLTIKELTFELKKKLKNIPSTYNDTKYERDQKVILKKLFENDQEITVSAGRVSGYLNKLDYVKKNGEWVIDKIKLKEKYDEEVLIRTLKKNANVKSNISGNLYIYPIELISNISAILIEEGISDYLGDLLYGCVNLKKCLLIYTNKEGYGKLDKLFKKISQSSITPIKVGD